MTYTVTGGSSAVTTRTEASDLNSLTAQYLAHYDLAKIDAAKALENPRAIAEAKQKFGITHADPIIENALAYTAWKGQVDFTRISEAGLRSNANESIAGTVNKNQNQDLSGGGSKPATEIGLSKSQREFVKEVKEKSATPSVDVYHPPLDTPGMKGINPRNNLEPPGP
jgi:hypothetical protein